MRKLGHKTRYLFNMMFWEKIVSLCTFDHYDYQVNRSTFRLRLPVTISVTGNIPNTNTQYGD